ncbi:hypothetical protein Tco_1135378 [Tanacetum coccineum]
MKRADPSNPPPPCSGFRSPNMRLRLRTMDGDSLLPSFMRRDINSLFGRIVSLSKKEAVFEDLTKEICNAEESVECKKLKKELEDARSSNTLLRMQKERVERDLYWTRVQAHEVYQEMIRRGVVFEERPNEAINVLVKDEESPSSEPRESPHDSY